MLQRKRHTLLLHVPLQGKEAVNFPLKSNHTFESEALWLKSAMIAAEQGRST